MNVLVVGNGAREHALIWKLAMSSTVDKLYCAPGNAGTGVFAHNVPIAASNIQGLADWAANNRIDMTIVGPERPLIEGIVNAFNRAGLRIFGPTAEAAVIEGSKVWTKQLLAKYGIPTGNAEIVNDYSQSEAILDRCSFPLAVKADGDAAGKGVVVARDREEAAQALKSFMVDHAVGRAGDRVLLEQYLEGVELSVLAFTDGQSVALMSPSCDYKRVADGDQGPNTGGMGAYAPPGFATPELMERIRRTIIEPTVEAMAAEGRPYSGVLYAGLMITEDGPKVLEFNCRLGDPETQVVLPLLKTDLAEIAEAVIDRRLSEVKVEQNPGACCGVVLASAGYPGSYATGLPIQGLDNLEEGILAFHAGTKMGPDPRKKDRWAKLKKELLIEQQRNDTLLTAGGRVLTLVACGPTMREAREKVYRNVDRVTFDGRHYRKDIALRELSAISDQPPA